MGDRVTADRWQRVLRRLDHTSLIAQTVPEETFDVLVALHAKKSAAAVASCRERCPQRFVMLALTGTDLHRDIHRDEQARRALDLADRLIVLYPGAEHVPSPRHRDKAVLVVQSLPSLQRRLRPRTRTFDVAVVGHLRPEKDPLRTALAARLLPSESRVRVHHARKVFHQRWRRKRRPRPRETALRVAGELPPGVLARSSEGADRRLLFLPVESSQHGNPHPEAA